jgi:pimeloyl-ACP methyl ester carboxylesterase
MYVNLARMLAARGCRAVRFDFSGIGDSPPRNDGTPPLLSCMQDIREILDWLQAQHGVRRVVLVGLCAGADHAVLYCRSDARVVGLVLMDPSLPPTKQYYFHYFMQRLGHLRNWLSVLGGRSGILRLLSRQLRNKLHAADDLGSLTLQDLPFSPYLRECYAVAAKRRTRLLAVFTSVSARHAYHRQILDAFPEVAAGGSIRLEYFAESDHLFSQPASRARLYNAIIEWLDLVE